MLKKRILTALVLIPITLLLLFFLPPGAFCFLTAVITLAAAWEWSHLIQIKTFPGQVFYFFLIGLLLLVALLIPAPAIFLLAFTWWLLAVLLIYFYPRGRERWGHSRFLRGLMGCFVLVPCWAAINFIRIQQDGIYILLFLFVLIWGADSSAYFAGKQWGKHKLAPLVSPGKTIEGLIGAIIFTLLVAGAALWLTATPQYLWLWSVALSLLTVLFSVVGDLFESMLKRLADLKDSGTFLPGHGGLLDRIDSLTAAAPVFSLGAWVLGLYFS
ncbi:phosphatidate cytidylyltransferase [Aquicella lusitana]|uniref:Phosphatidate cytidylyltransferase n=1 Tax=Aquicella lusitana TaxID=254246 RepID=A0A370GD99_9COXI|nr:phosphatidate cytidylyltransferase [Aquicella lusitana]RDI41802.1 phosphatidate cytidylyltransferase [Aquicella lusitana]VVC73710.1 Phosphatidate cytidylyltransferase [Aquicella lusitana]